MDVARLYTGTQNEHDVYDISVKSELSCTPNGGFNPVTPVAGNQCSDIMHSAWKDCESSVQTSPYDLFAIFRQQS